MFNYFLPGVSLAHLAPDGQIDHATLRMLGLAEVLGDVFKVPEHASVIDVKSGPNGRAGCVIAPVRVHHGPPAVAFNPQYQTWKECGSYWLGWKNGETPTPSFLERWEVIPGQRVLDRKRQEWTIPIARAPSHGYEFGFLPQAYTFDDSGEPKPNLDPDFAWLWELAGQIRDWYRNSRPPAEDATPAEKQAYVPPKFNDLVRFATRILAVNYRLGLAELNVLHQLGVALLTQDTVHAICKTTFGWEIEEEAKKKQPGEETATVPSLLPLTTGDVTLAAAPGTDPAAAL